MEAENILIDPCDVYWGKYAQDKITCVADSASSLSAKWFRIYSALDAVKYYVYIKVATVGADPAPAGHTSLGYIDVAVGASASTVATALAAFLTGKDPFHAYSINADVYVTRHQPGLTTISSNGTASPGFSYSQEEAGSYDDMGYIDGDISFDPQEKTKEVKAHQTGEDILTALRTGKGGSLKMTLQETDRANLDRIFGQAGAKYTPSAGTEVVGWGSSTNGQNILKHAGKLVLHPHNNSGSDYSEDWAFWRAYLMPTAVKISGENPRTVEVTFQLFTANEKKASVNLFCIGDHTQNFHS